MKTIKATTSYIIITLLTFFSLSSVSYADVRNLGSHACIKIYDPGRVKLRGNWRKPHQLARAIGDSTEPRYVPKGFIKVLKDVEVSNQCQTYECYLFAVVNHINVQNKARFGDEASLISEPYLVAHKFLEHIKEAMLLGPDHPQLIHDLEGGFPYEAFHLSRTVGLVPRTAWKVLKPLDQWDTAKIYRTLKREIPKKHEELRIIAKKYGWDSAELKIAHAKYYDNLKYVILDNSGPLPTEFMYRGKLYTPQSWEQEFGIPRIALLEINNKEGNVLPDNYPNVLRQIMSNQGGHYRVVVGNYNSLIQKLKDYIDADSSVIIDLHWKNDGHSMLVTGYELNEANEVVRFKFMNSWGKDFGNRGYAWYTPADIWKNITGSYHFEAPPR